MMVEWNHHDGLGWLWLKPQSGSWGSSREQAVFGWVLHYIIITAMLP